MKTATIITIHIGANFGSILQTVATSETLKKLDVNPVVINYIPDRVTWKRLFSSNKNPFKLFLAIANRFINNRIYNGYLKKYTKLTKKIYSKDSLKKVCYKADFYITGSDQVWNSNYNEGIDTKYFYHGVEGNKIAYASSIGSEYLASNEKSIFFKFLADYSAVSVREKSAQSILKEIGIDSTLLLDPTFMLDRYEWCKYASNYEIKCPYILVYLPYNILNKETIYQTVRKIAKVKKLLVVSFSWGRKNDIYADKTIKFASPGDFLSLMIKADYVITNSFHGTAFSINLNKQFWVYKPSMFSTRIENILELCMLSNRRLSSEISDEAIENRIDYTSINKVLDLERNKSMSFLREALK